MGSGIQIDITFDFRSDTPPGRDPDVLSPTLRLYHKLLWSKPLPSGVVLELVDTTPHAYLHHQSQVGEFWLSSDAVIPTFTREKRVSHILNQIAVEEQDAFNGVSYTIGGMMVFPGNRIGRKMTINGARGFHPRIKDRFDLTVECIRRHYGNESSPLSAKRREEVFTREYLCREIFRYFESQRTRLKLSADDVKAGLGTEGYDNCNGFGFTPASSKPNLFTKSDVINPDPPKSWFKSYTKALSALLSAHRGTCLG